MQDFFKLTFKQLMLSNVFLGSRRDSFNMIMKPFILGYRGSFCILNLSYSYIQFKLLIHVLFNIIFLRKKVLVVKENDIHNFKIDLKARNLYFYDKKWIGGCLTNFKIVSRHPKFLELSKSFPNLRTLRYLPSFIFLFDSNISEAALFEGYVLGIPTSAMVNSDCLFFESINYPVLGNTECYESMYFYMNVVRDAIKLGSEKEDLKILRIRKKLKKKLKIKLKIRKKQKKYKFLC
jgi:ribosomal protein S2